MKKLMNKLKFGALLTGFIFISSCMGDVTSFTNAGEIKSIIELPASILKINQVAGLAKHVVRPNQIVTAMPISFGTADVTLILN